MTVQRLLTILACAIAFSGCGGGSSPQAAAPQTCGFGLVYADGGTSGYAVGSTAAISVPKSIAPCSITQVQSVALGLCVNPADVSELKVQLLGANSVPTLVNLASVTTSGSCLLTGTLYKLNLPASALGSVTDSWRLSVEDTRPGYTNSYFVGWSLEVKGLQ
jgi:hypothetical protein